MSDRFGGVREDGEIIWCSGMASVVVMRKNVCRGRVCLMLRVCCGRVCCRRFVVEGLLWTIFILRIRFPPGSSITPGVFPLLPNSSNMAAINSPPRY